VEIVAIELVDKFATIDASNPERPLVKSGDWKSISYGIIRRFRERDGATENEGH
jgi:hypothetical protein